MHSHSAITLCTMCEDTAVTEMTTLPVSVGVRLPTHPVQRCPVSTHSQCQPRYDVH